MTAISNSKTQAAHISAQARMRGLKNVQAITADVVTYQAPKQRFDRAVSVEMFEHMKNYKVETGLGRDGCSLRSSWGSSCSPRLPLCICHSHLLLQDFVLAMIYVRASLSFAQLAM